MRKDVRGIGSEVSGFKQQQFFQLWFRKDRDTGKRIYQIL